MKQILFLIVINATRLDNEWARIYERLVQIKCGYDERTRSHKGKLKVIGRIAGQIIEMIYALLKKDAEVMSKVLPGVKPPGATLYFTQQQALLSDTASKQQHQIDTQLANDQQQETILKSYVDDVSDLLLNHNLRNSKPGVEVRQVARERTLTTLRRLKADRNKIVLQFLQDAHLIGIDSAVINLSGAEMSFADLSGANLSRADLSEANFTGDKVTEEQLKRARSLKGATLPDGSKHP